MPRPMPNPMMMAGRMNPMMGGMNPMMRGMNPMMRGMNMGMPRMMAREGGIMQMASAPDPMDERNSMMENLAMEYFGKPLRLLNEQEIIEIEEMMDNMDTYGSKPMPQLDREMPMMQASYGYDDAMAEAFDAYEKAIKDGIIPPTMEFDEYLELMQDSKKETAPRTMAQEGGLMDMGGMEKDYRNEGGFVPIGGQERADDVPARLSKNEFVFTADAVRNAGGGDIDKGAEVMENMMENLEKGGKVSEESQGLKGARDMFATAQRLEGVL